MTETRKIKRLAFDIKPEDEKLIRSFKSECAKEGKTIRNVLLEFMRGFTKE